MTVDADFAQRYKGAIELRLREKRRGLRDKSYVLSSGATCKEKI